MAGEKTEKKTSKNLSLKEIKEAIKQEEEASQRRKKRLELERTKKIDKVFFWLGEYVIQDASLLESFLKNKEYIARFTDADMALVKEVIETRQEEAAEKARKAEEKRTRLGAEEQKNAETNQTPKAKANQPQKVEEKQKAVEDYSQKTTQQTEHKRVYLTSEYTEQGLIKKALESALGKERSPESWDFDADKKQWFFVDDGKVDTTPLKKWLPESPA